MFKRLSLLILTLFIMNSAYALQTLSPGTTYTTVVRGQLYTYLELVNIDARYYVCSFDVKQGHRGDLIYFLKFTGSPSSMIFEPNSNNTLLKINATNIKAKGRATFALTSNRYLGQKNLVNVTCS